MADTKLTALTADTTRDLTDLVYTVTDPSGTPASRKMTVNDLFREVATELTISAGAVTFTQLNHKLQPQTGTADDLDTINGTTAGQSGVIYASDFGTDTITIKHNTGNILCVGNADITLSNGCVFWHSNGTKVFISGGGGGGGVESVVAGTNVTVDNTDPANPVVSASGGGDIGCRVYNSSDISISNSTVVYLTFDSELYDTDTMHSTSSNTSRITFTTAGKYVVGCNVQYDSNATGLRHLFILLNGAGAGIAYSLINSVSGSDCVMYISTIYNFAAGDYVEFGVYQNSGSSINVEARTYSIHAFASKVG